MCDEEVLRRQRCSCLLYATALLTVMRGCLLFGREFTNLLTGVLLGLLVIL